MGNRQQEKLTFQPALNGVRGLAMLMIFFFHCGFFCSSGTFLSVDMFFSLSGFLITLLLLQEWQASGNISLKKFYLRRILRLFPALLFLLLLYFIFCLSVFDGTERDRYFSEIPIVLFYMANWFRALHLGELNVLGHCWSLSVEEQFYIFWPFCFLLLVRLRPLPRSGVIFILFSLSWAWRLYLLHNGADWSRLYNDSFARIGMILAGAFAACLYHDEILIPFLYKTNLRTSIASGISLGSILLMTFIANWQSAITYSIYLFFFAIAMALLLIDLTCRPHSPAARILSCPVLVYTGTLSYGIYLFHYPVIKLLTTIYPDSLKEGNIMLPVYAALLTLVFSLISWFTLERPAERLKRNLFST